MPLDRIDAGDPDSLARQLAARFADLHGRAPSGVFAAPGRVNLIGEHVDYNGGRCLPMALPHATYAAMSARSDDTVTVTSLQQDDPWRGTTDGLGPGAVSGWPAYVAGVLWALGEQGRGLPGFDIVVDSRVPVGAGLSSSAALECSVALGAVALGAVALGAVELASAERAAIVQGTAKSTSPPPATPATADDHTRRRLVEACIRAENEVAGAATGGMDQTIALFGRAGHALLLDTRDWSRRQVPWPDAGVDLLVVDTRASHTLTDGGYESRRRACEQAASALGVELLCDVTDREGALAALDDEVLRRRVRHVFSEMDRVDQAVAQLAAGDFRALGSTFVASHASLRDDYEVSCAELDVVVDTALDAGALGARMTGGGFGGSAIALVPHEQVAAVADAVAREFAGRGWTAPGFLVATPAAGARRLL